MIIDSLLFPKIEVSDPDWDSKLKPSYAWTPAALGALAAAGAAFCATAANVYISASVVAIPAIVLTAISVGAFAAAFTWCAGALAATATLLVGAYALAFTSALVLGSVSLPGVALFATAGLTGIFDAKQSIAKAYQCEQAVEGHKQAIKNLNSAGKGVLLALSGAFLIDQGVYIAHSMGKVDVSKWPTFYQPIMYKLEKALAKV